MKQKDWSEIQQAIKEQKEFCKANDKPHFAPIDGRCFNCGANVYKNGSVEGWDGKSLVTGCRHCHYSFCD